MIARWGAAGSLASLALWRWVGALEHERSILVLGMGTLYLVAAGLLAAREDPLAPMQWGHVLGSLPSLGVSAVILASAAAPAAWDILTKVLFLVGLAVTVVALLSLGRSFSLLPSRRAIVTRCAYRVVRHPAYAGELLMSVACVLPTLRGADSSAPLLAIAALVLLLGAVVTRICIEESVLGADANYQAYASTVRYRLVPGVW